MPRHHKSRTVSAKYRVRSVFKITLGVVSGTFYYLFSVVARLVTVADTGQPALTASEGNNLSCVIVKRGDRTATHYNGHILVGGFNFEFSISCLQIRHSLSYGSRWDLKSESVKWLKESASRFHQAVPHRAKRCLAEVTTLGMLEVRFPRDESYLRVGKYGTRKRSSVVFFI